MAKRSQAGQKRWAGMLAFALVAGTGCSTTPTASNQAVDPLHGHRSPPGIPIPDSQKNVPAAPTSLAPRLGGSDFSSSNNATLAGLSGLTPLGRPLAIDDQGRGLAPGQLTSGSTLQTPTQLGYQAPNANPKVEAIPDVVATPAPSKFSPTGWQPEPAAVASPLPATEVLSRQLQERGVVSQKVDPLPEGVYLTCYVANSQGGGLRKLEVTAVDYTTAAQAILRQLDTVR